MQVKAEVLVLLTALYHLPKTESILWAPLTPVPKSQAIKSWTDVYVGRKGMGEKK